MDVQSSAVALTFDEIRKFLQSITALESTLNGVPAQLSAVSNFSALRSALASALGGVYNLRRDQASAVRNFIQTLPAALAQRLASAAATNVTSIFDSLLLPATVPALKEEFAAYNVMMTHLAAAMTQPVPAIKSVVTTMNSIASISNSLGEFDSLSEAFSAFGYSYDAGQSASLALYTVSRVGQALTSAATAGSDGLQQFSDGLDATYAALRSMMLSAVSGDDFTSRLNVSAAAQALLDLAPQGSAILSMLDDMLQLVPSLGDTVVINLPAMASGLPALNLTLSGSSAASIQESLRNLPSDDAMTAAVASVSQILGNINPEDRPELVSAVVGAASEIAAAAGTTLRVVSAGGQLYLPLATDDGQAAIQATIASGILPCINATSAVLAAAVAQLQKYGTPAWSDNDAYNTFVQLSELRDGALLSSCAGATSTSLGQIAALASAFGFNSSDLVNLLVGVSVFMPAADLADYDLQAVSQQLSTLQSLQSAPGLAVLLGGLSSSLPTAVSAVTSLLPSAKAVGVYAASDLEFAGSSIVVDGDFGLLAQVPTSILTALSALDTATQVFYYFVFPDSRPAGLHLTATVLQAINSATAAVAQLDAGLPILSDEGRIASALGLASELATRTVAAASLMQLADQTASAAQDAMLAASNTLAQLKRGFVSPVVTVSTVLNSTASVSSALWDAAGAYWAMKSMDFSRFNELIACALNQYTSLVVNASRIVALDTTFKSILGNSGIDSRAVASAVDPVQLLQYGTPAGRAAIVDAVLSVLNLASTAVARLNNSTILSDLSNRVSGNAASVSQLNSNVLSIIISQDNVTSAYLTARDKLAHFRAAFSLLNLTAAGYNDTLQLLGAVASDLNSCGVFNVSDVTPALGFRLMTQFLDSSPAYQSLHNYSTALATAANISISVASAQTVFGSLLPQLATALGNGPQLATLVNLSSLDATIRDMIETLSHVSSFYGNSSAVYNPDAASALLSEIQTNVAAIAPAIRGLQAAPIAASLATVAGLTTSLSTVTRLRGDVRLNDPMSVAPSLALGYTSAAVVNDTLTNQLAGYGITYDQLSSSQQQLGASPLQLRDGFNAAFDIAAYDPKLSDLIGAASGAAMAVADSAPALSFLRSVWTAYVTNSANASSLSPVSMDAVWTALEDASNILASAASPSLFATVIRDLSAYASGTAATSSDSAFSSGEVLSALTDATAAVNSTLAQVSALTAPLCQTLSALQLRTSLPTTASAVSSLATFTTDAEHAVETAVVLLRSFSPVSGLQALYGNLSAIADAIAEYSRLSSAARAARKLPLQPATINAALAFEALLCGNASALTTLNASLAALVTVTTAYQSSRQDSAAFSSAAPRLAYLVGNASAALASVSSQLGNVTAISNGVTAVTQSTRSLAAVRDVAAYVDGATPLSRALLSSLSTLVELPSAAYVALGSPPDAVMSLLQAAATARRIGTASGWVASAYSSVASDASLRELWCMLSQWYASDDSSSLDSPILSPSGSGTSSYSGSATVRPTTASASLTQSRTGTNTGSGTQTYSNTATGTRTGSNTGSNTASGTGTGTSALSATGSKSSTGTRSRNSSPSATASKKSTSSATASATATTRSASITVSRSVSSSVTRTGTVTGSQRSSSSSTGSATATLRLTPTSTMTATSLPSVRPVPVQCAAYSGDGTLSGLRLQQLAEAALSSFAGLQDAVAQAPSVPGTLTSSALTSAIADSSYALSGLASLASARDRLARLVKLMDAVLAAADGLPLSYSNVRYDAYNLATFLRATSATIAPPPSVYDANAAFSEPVQPLSSPALLDSISRSAGLLALTPTVLRISADFPRPDVAQLSQLSAAVTRQQALVSTILLASQQADTIGQAYGAMKFAVGALSGSAFNAKESSDVLYALSRFRVSLPKLTTLMANVRSHSSNSNNATADASTFTARAYSLVAEVDAALRFMGPTFPLVPSALAKASSLIGSFSNFSFSGFNELSSALQSALDAVASLPANPVVVAAGLGRYAATAASAAGNVTGAPRLLSSISSLTSLSVAPSDLDPVIAVSKSVLQLGTLSGIVATLNGALANATAIRGALQAAQALLNVGGDESYKSSLSLISTTLHSLSTASTGTQGALSALQGYLSTSDATGTALINGALSIVGSTVDLYPSFPGAYQQAGAWSQLTAALSALSQNSDVIGAAELADSTASTLSWLLSTTSSVTQSSLGVSSSLLHSLGNTTTSAGLLEALQAASSLLRLLNATSASLSDTPQRVDQLLNGTAGLRDVQLRVADVRQIASRSIITGSPSVLNTALSSFSVGNSAPSLFAPAGAYFDILASINSTVTLFRALTALLRDSAGQCPSAIQTNPAFVTTTSGGKSPDALQCAALAAAGNLTAASSASGVLTATSGSQSVKINVTRCPSASVLTSLGLNLTSLLPSSAAVAASLTQYSSLSSQSGFYGAVGRALNGGSLPPAPIPGLGFCFAPSVVKGPCVALRRQLTTFAQSIGDSIELAGAGQSFAVSTLAAMFGSQLNNVSVYLRDATFPSLSSFYDSADTLSSSVLSAVSRALEAVNVSSSARRLELTGRADHGGDDSIDNNNYLQYAPGMASFLISADAYAGPQDDAGALRSRLLWVDMGLTSASSAPPSHSRQLAAQSGGATSALLSVVSSFLTTADDRLAALAVALGPKVPLEAVAVAAELGQLAPQQAQAALGLLPTWMAKLTKSADLTSTIQSFLSQSSAVRAVGVAMYPLITKFQAALAFLRDPTIRSASQLSDAVTLVAQTSALGYNVSATWRRLAPSVVKQTMDLYIHNRGGFTDDELQPYTNVPWCAANSSRVCLRQIVRAAPKYLSTYIPAKLMMWYDLNTPSLAEGGGEEEAAIVRMLSTATNRYSADAASYFAAFKSAPSLQTLMLLSPGVSSDTALSYAQAVPATVSSDGSNSSFVPATEVVQTWFGSRLKSKSKRWSWTIAGLFDNYRPRGVTFWGDPGAVPPYVITCMQADEPFLLGNNTPSILVVYQRNSPEVFKAIELWINETTPFVGTCGGIALAARFLYVTDDTNQEGWVYGFAKGDVDAQLRSGRGQGKIQVTSVEGRPLIVNLAVTASHIYWDADLTTPRLW